MEQEENEEEEEAFRIQELRLSGPRIYAAETLCSGRNHVNCLQVDSVTDVPTLSIYFYNTFDLSTL